VSDNIPAHTVTGPIAAGDVARSHEAHGREATGPSRVATSDLNAHAGPGDDLEPAAVRLADEIRGRRKAAGLSHAQLAVKTGYTRQYVSLAERPRKGLPSVDLVREQAERARQARRARDAGSEVAATPTPVAPQLPRRLTVGREELVEQIPTNEQLVDTVMKRERSPGRRRRLVASSSDHLDEIIAHLRDQWHALVRTDNLLGPRFAITGVLNQIAAIEELSSSLRGQQRLAVVRLGAQYAESAAWLYEDAGHMAKAHYWTSRAMELAHEGDDARMVAWTVFRRSQQAAAALDTARAIGLAQAARRHEEGLATPTRAAIRVQEAYSHALDGDHHTAQTLLDEAHTWAANDTRGDAHEGHGSYCTPSYIEIQRANCWLTTGKPKKAIALYEESLHTLPVVYQRSRAAALSRLAVAYIADGQLEQAASAARTALPVARSGGSMRIIDELKSVGSHLVPHQQLQGVAALLHELADDEES
jgi:transcriptional regulator with XRE-family HTH domain